MLIVHGAYWCKIRWNLNTNTTFIEEIEFKKAICKIWGILFRPQWLRIDCFTSSSFSAAPLDEAGVNLVELHKWAIGSDWKALVKPEKIYSRDQQGNT